MSISTHEAGTELVTNLAELSAWLETNAPEYDAEELVGKVERHAAGRLPVFPMQCRASPDNKLAQDAKGRGNIDECVSVFPTFGNPEFGRINRMSLEIVRPGT